MVSDRLHYRLHQLVGPAEQAVQDKEDLVGAEFFLEYIYKTVFAQESGHPGVPFSEKKTEGRKSRETVPLRYTERLFMIARPNIKKTKNLR
jgi:hypothetical protein